MWQQPGLPPELWSMVCGYLPADALKRASSVSQQSRAVCRDLLWTSPVFRVDPSPVTVDDLEAIAKLKVPIKSVKLSNLPSSFILPLYIKTFIDVFLNI